MRTSLGLARVLAALALLVYGMGAATAGQRLALVIGNSAYSRIVPVAQAKPDTEAATAVLKDAGFTVIEKRETDAAGLKKAFKNFAVALTGDDDIVIYFSGQALALEGENYLLPVDTPGDGQEAIKSSAVALKSMLADFQESKPHMLLLIVDACRPNPFPSGLGTTGLAPVTPGTRQVVLFSAAQGKTALESLGKDDPRHYSPFVRVLMKELSAPGAALADALRAVQTNVAAQAQAAGQNQSPALFGQAPADFLFRPAGANPGENSTRLLASEERQIWGAADSQHQESTYRNLLKVFPGGDLAVKAKDRLDDLAVWEEARGGNLEALRRYVSAHPEGLFSQKARSLLDEGELWEKARTQSDVALLRDYLNRYPQGRFAAPAGSLLARLDAAAAAKRDEDAWTTAKTANSTPAFEAYLHAYPDGRFAPQARESVEQIAWDAAKKGGSAASMEEYLKVYPSGRFASAAKTAVEDIAWDQAKKGNSETAYGEYLKIFPKGRYAETAKDTIEQIVWTNAQKARTLPLTLAYLERYPQGKFALQAREQEEDIAWDEVRGCDPNDQSRDIYRCDNLADAFMQRYGSARHAGEAATLHQGLKASRPEREERKALSDALKSGETSQMQAVLDRFPNGRHYVEAMEKLTELWRAKETLPISGTSFRDDFSDAKDKGPEMVALPAGKFTMGGDESLPEKPAHPVLIVHPFALGKYEVTFDEWDACIADKGCSYRPEDEVSVLMFRWKGRGKMPVINLNWGDVQQYLTWLSKKTGKKYRLPTEAEWEYAARGGTTTRYYFGNGDDALPKHGWYTGNAQRETHLVGQLAASPSGFHDIYGNVAEWTQDCWHSNYEGAPLNGSVAWSGNCVGSAHVTRGGYFFDTASNVRSASRGRVGDSMRSPGVGFRLARDYP